MHRTKTIIYSALFAAITGVMAQIVIPLAPVPINGALIAVILSGVFLGKKTGPLSLFIYIMAGAVGIPVFAGLQGGVYVLTGPTGGFILGYIPAAYIAGSMSVGKFINYIFAGLSAVVVCYITGTAWYIYITGNTFVSAISVCVLPFILGDILKIFFAAFIAEKICRRRNF